MEIILLDAAVGPMILIGIGFLILFFAGIILIETCIMMAFRYAIFRKALLDSFLVNLASAVAGIIMQFTIAESFMRSFGPGISIGSQMDRQLMYLFLLFAITLVIELLVMSKLNSAISTRRIVLICLVMNIGSYLFLLFGWPF